MVRFGRARGPVLDPAIDLAVRYVCSALNCNRTGSAGIGPIVSGSNGFSSGEAVGRDHVTLVTGDPMAPPSTVVVHPATAGRSTSVIGTPSGKKSCTCVVPASACSFSTESCSVTTLPVPASSGIELAVRPCRPGDEQHAEERGGARRTAFDAWLTSSVGRERILRVSRPATAREFPTGSRRADDSQRCDRGTEDESMPFVVLDDEIPQSVPGVLDGADDTDVPAHVLGVERIGIGHVEVHVRLDAFAWTGEDLTPADLQVDRHALAVHDRIDGALVGVDAVVDPLLGIELEAENVAEVVRGGAHVTAAEYGSDAPRHDCMLARDRYRSQCPGVRHEARIGERHVTAPDDVVTRVPRAFVRTPEGWERIEATGWGPFITRATFRTPQGEIVTWESRAHRKRHTGDAGAASIWWAPRALAWWIGVLFMIGSTCFALGALPGYLDAVGVNTDNLTYFVGSLFFTSAALLQYVEVVRTPDTFGLPGSGARRAALWQPHRIDWWATIVQLVGTLYFNVSTGFAFFAALDTAQANRLIWRPDALGSICFLVASGLAWAEVAHGLFRRARGLSGWIAFLNLMGSVAFGVSAVAAYLTPDSGEPRNVELVNLGTFVGALCFLVGAALLLPERMPRTE